MLKGTSTLDYGLYFKLSDFKGGMEVQEVKVREALKILIVDTFIVLALKILHLFRGLLSHTGFLKNLERHFFILL